MARLFTPDGKYEADPATVNALARSLGLTLRHLPLPQDPHTAALLARPELDPAQQAQLLQYLDASLGQAVPAPTLHERSPPGYGLAQAGPGGEP